MGSVVIGMVGKRLMIGTSSGAAVPRARTPALHQRFPSAPPIDRCGDPLQSSRGALRRLAYSGLHRVGRSAERISGRPPPSERAPDWSRISKVGRTSTPETTLWFWNSELGWATVHPVLVANGWEYRACHIWDKGLSHVAGNANTKTLRKFPVTTEVCVQYVKSPHDGDAGWRHEWPNRPPVPLGQRCLRRSRRPESISQRSPLVFPAAGGFPELGRICQ